MSTTGYGDIVPESGTGRVIAIIAIFLGISASSILSGSLATLLLRRQSTMQKGLVNHIVARNHTIICGWRKNMHSFLAALKPSQHIQNEKIVIVAEPPQAWVDEFFTMSYPFKVEFIRANYVEKEGLMKARLPLAKKVIVLADQSKDLSVFEIDSRTVMTVFTIKNVNKAIHVSAQLIERNFEMYLKNANCDEILFSQSINNQMLQMFINENGIGNVISGLMGLLRFSPSSLTLEAVPEKFIGKEYSLLKAHYELQKNKIMLGLLENTSNFDEIKYTSIREAQKTANFSKMVKRISEVKDLIPYKPVFVPSPDYKVNGYSKAIILCNDHNTQQ